MNQLYQCSGRRKKSIARVFLKQKLEGDNYFSINNKTIEEYFCNQVDQYKVKCLFDYVKDQVFKTTVNVRGGGMTGQAEAIRLGIAKALVQFNNDLRTVFKKQDFLTRDSRRVERKKPGHLKARKKKQFNKR